MSELQRFKTICETIAFLHPDMPMSEALPLAEQIEVAAKTQMLPTTFSELKELARRSPRVTDCLPHKRINAIKELRAIIHEMAVERYGNWDSAPEDVRNIGGLKSCKEAVEAL